MATQIYGGFWRRFFAFMLDNLIIYLLSWIVFLIGLFALGASAVLPDLATGWGRMLTAAFRIAILFNILYLFMCMSYFTYFTAICGSTPGKMIFRLKVIRENGEAPSFVTAFLRWIGYISRP